LEPVNIFVIKIKESQNGFIVDGYIYKGQVGQGGELKGVYYVIAFYGIGNCMSTI
jgi:hypothetical protein